MPSFALIKNNIVENVIVADQEFATTLTSQYDHVIDVSDGRAGIGAEYDGTDFVTPPAPEPTPDPEPTPKQYTQLEYQSLFTLAELVAVEVAAGTDPTLRVLQRMQQAATYISLADPRTLQGMQYLVSAGILTQARYDEILTHVYA